MAERKSLKQTLGKKLGNLFKTDIPPLVQSKPGHTVKKKNFVYISGPSTWKAKAREKAAKDGNIITNTQDTSTTQGTKTEYVVQRGNNPSSAAVPADVFFTVERPGSRPHKHAEDSNNNNINGLTSSNRSLTSGVAVSNQHSFVSSHDVLLQGARTNGSGAPPLPPPLPKTMITSTTPMVSPNVSRQNSFQVVELSFYTGEI